jgi:hypothetical protein
MIAIWVKVAEWIAGMVGGERSCTSKKAIWGIDGRNKGSF